MTEASDLRVALARARGRQDYAEVRRLLAALAALRGPEKALAPKTTETREG